MSAILGWVFPAKVAGLGVSVCEGSRTLLRYSEGREFGGDYCASVNIYNCEGIRKFWGVLAYTIAKLSSSSTDILVTQGGIYRGST